MLLTFYFLLFLVCPMPILALINSSVLFEENLHPQEELIKCALFVTKRYMSPMTNTLVVKDICIRCNKIQSLLNFYLQNFNTTMAVKLHLGKSTDQLWNYCTFIVDEPKAFKELRFRIPQNQHEREFFFFIILTELSSNPSTRRQIMFEIFHTFVFLKVLHVVIMALDQGQANAIVFYTYYFAGNSYCGDKINIVEINHYRAGKLQADYLFLPDVINFQQCKLNIIAAMYNPWLGFNGNTSNINHTSDIKRLTGIEGDYIRLLAKTINFTINLHFKAERGIINLQENSTGCFADLETGAADIALGGLSVAYYNISKFSVSIPYFSSSQVFYVRSDLYFGPFERLAKPFDLIVWLAIAATILIALLLLKMINHSAARTFLIGAQNPHPSSNLFRILLGNAILRPPHGNFARYLLMSWFLLTLILRNAYQGMLFDSLRVSRRAPIPMGVAALIDKNYIMLSSAYAEYYPHNLTVMVPNVVDQVNEVLNSERKLIVVTALDTMGYFNFIFRNSSRLLRISDRAHVLHMTMFFQKNSMLKPVFDKKINLLKFSGISSHWGNKQFKRTEFRTMFTDTHKAKRINNRMLQGLYMLYGILSVLGICCFSLEILTQKSIELKRFFDAVHN